MLSHILCCLLICAVTAKRVVQLGNCDPPFEGGIVEFAKQCDVGHCRRSVHAEKLLQKFSPAASALPSSEYSCHPGMFYNEVVWTHSSLAINPQDRTLALKDPSLLKAMQLSFEISSFDSVSPAKRMAIDDAESMAERLAAMGIGEPLPYTGMVSTKAFEDFAGRRLRGLESSEDSSWWLDTSGFSALGLFDGHGGPEASDNAAYLLFQSLVTRWLSRLSNPESGTDASTFWSRALPEMLGEAQARLRATQKKVVGGTTASIVVADKESGTAAVTWLGDSQVLHARRHDGESSWRQEWLSSMHHCDDDQDWIERPDQTAWCDMSGEKPRTCRGDRKQGRFKTCIGITRTLGDFSHLDAGDVLDTPETHQLKLLPNDVILAASDGLWDMVTVEEVLELLGKLESTSAKSEWWLRKYIGEISDLAKQRWVQAGIKMDDVTVLAMVVRSDGNLVSPQGLVLAQQSFLENGGIGDWCSGTCFNTYQYAKSLVREIKESTCGHAVIGGTNWQTQKLCCSRPGRDTYGKCVIPLGGRCVGKSSGCIAGSRCIPPILPGGEHTCERQDSYKALYSNAPSKFFPSAFSAA
eukprot:TRINITY_DN25445_c0_g1_i2.p1 TRINITY_DN25445_c0_g1~~TRINITY_DN25445_c0_g1_i2.p1  ORF type:complete len:593 (+),score=73.47 TRINITY_DN25445_c0_g1_i2:36-1781(+)